MSGGRAAPWFDSPMRGVRITLLLGLTLLAGGVGLVLLHSPMSVAATNGVTPDTQRAVALASRDTSYCQAGETLPPRTSAIRVSMVAALGPRVRVEVSSNAGAITGGEQGSGWTGESVTVPVKLVPRAIPAATVCVSFHLRDGTVYLLGEKTPADIAAREGTQTLPGRMRLEYLHAGSRSWASLIPAVITALGFSHAMAGVLVVLVVLGLVATTVLLASSLVLTDLR